MIKKHNISNIFETLLFEVKTWNMIRISWIPDMNQTK